MPCFPKFESTLLRYMNCLLQKTIPQDDGCNHHFGTRRNLVITYQITNHTHLLGKNKSDLWHLTEKVADTTKNQEGILNTCRVHASAPNKTCFFSVVYQLPQSCFASLVFLQYLSDLNFLENILGGLSPLNRYFCQLNSFT